MVKATRSSGTPGRLLAALGKDQAAWQWRQAACRLEQVTCLHASRLLTAASTPDGGCNVTAAGLPSGGRLLLHGDYSERPERTRGKHLTFSALSEVHNHPLLVTTEGTPDEQ